MSKSRNIKDQSTSFQLNRLGIILKEERKTNRMLADIMGYDETTVSKWATNTVQPPIITFYRIALILNRNFQDFFVNTDDVAATDRSKQLKVLESLALKAKKRGKTRR